MIDSTNGLWRKNCLAIRLSALDIRKSVVMQTRDYSLLGKDGQKAVETGLAGANWYATIIPRKEMKEFTDVLMGPPFGTHSFGWLLYSDLQVLALLFGLPGGLPPSGSPTAYFMDHLQIVDGTNAAMARPSRRAG